MQQLDTKIAIIGTGITGIATAFYLAKNHGVYDITLIDRGQPMAFTSAQSGENYRNWWPHPVMQEFTDRSIDLMEEIALASDNRINMTRRGYSLVTRSADVDEIIQQFETSPESNACNFLREHTGSANSSYEFATSSDWQSAPSGVDILRDTDLIRRAFPSYADDAHTIVHLRRGGDLSGQQLGAYMLEYLKSVGLRSLCGSVEQIHQANGFNLTIQTVDGPTALQADIVVNAAGPFADRIAQLLDTELPIYNVLQQKITFEDREKAIPREMPFTIDLDNQTLDWTEDELSLLSESDEFRWLTEEMPGSIHCRPDGGDNGTWLKMGWAFNQNRQTPDWMPSLDTNFPEIVLRGAARLNPSLKAYYDHLPRNMHHYGGWYTMTDENVPLIGPMGPEGAFMNCAHSGFGTMGACAAGEICAAWVTNGPLTKHARALSLERYQDPVLMKELQKAGTGIL